jgi:RNA polymerase sigma factor (sigma-70 family)
MASNKKSVNSENFADFISRLKANDEYSWKDLDFVLKRILSKRMLIKGIDFESIDRIYQDTFSTFYQKFHTCSFENFIKLKSYVLAILENKIKEENRSKIKNQKLLAIDNINPLFLSSALYYEQRTMFSETNAAVRKLLDSLDNRERTIIYNLYYKGENIKNISKRLGISSENCRVIKHRAIKKLKEMVGNKWDK